MAAINQWLMLLAMTGIWGTSPGPPPVTMTLRPAMMLSEGDIVATVRVARNEANRKLALTWECDCGAAGGSSRDLEGEDSPVTHLFTLREQPPGHWTFVAALYGPGGRLLARTIEEIQGASR